MPKTRADLIAEVDSLLGITGVGDTLSAEDRAVIDAKIDPKISELSTRQIVYIADDENIEDEYFDALATLVAESVGPKFGRPRDLAVRLEAETRLLEMQGSSPEDGETGEAAYF
jgi:hypothetical protein